VRSTAPELNGDEGESLLGSGSSSEAQGSSGTCIRGERLGEMARHRWSGVKQRWCSGDGLSGEGSGGGADKMHREGPLL
jgi:hypothetical protein